MSARAATLTLEETMAALRISRKTVIRLIRRGELPAYKAGRQWRIDETDIDAYKVKQKAAVIAPARPRMPITPSPRRSPSSGVTWKGADRYSK